MTPEYRFKRLKWRYLGFLRGLRNDERVNRWLISPAVLLSEEAQYIWYEDAYLPGETRIFVLEVDGEPAGYGQIKNIDYLHRSAEVGIVVAPEHQGRGYGHLLVYHLLALCFGELGLYRAWLQVFSDNERAIGLYHHCGFDREGTLRHAAFKDGKFRDLVVMAVINESGDD